jgi:hypothetical protein
MKIGVPYRIGTNPPVIVVPIATPDGFFSSTKVVPFEGDIANTYYACKIANNPKGEKEQE